MQRSEQKRAAVRRETSQEEAGRTVSERAPGRLSVLMISSDRKIFEKDSAVRRRMIAFGDRLAQLHIIVFAHKRLGLTEQRLADNVWAYPTNSTSRWLYGYDALRSAQKQLQFAFGFHVDVVTAQDPFEGGLAAYLIARKHRRRLQLQVHADLFNPRFRKGLLNRVRLHLSYFLIPRAQCVRTVSPGTARELERRYPHLAGRIVTLPVHVDVESFASAESSFNLHKSYPQFTFIILMVTRLSEEKNLPFALALFARLQRRYPRAGLVIVGEGPEEKRLKREVERLRLLNSVVFELWQEDIRSHYKTANLLLLTSAHESYGMVLIEAAAAGLPFVTSDVGVAAAFPERIRSETVCPVGDMECFAEKVAAHIGNTERRASFAINMRSDILASVSGSEERYLEAFEESFKPCFLES